MVVAAPTTLGGDPAPDVHEVRVAPSPRPSSLFLPSPFASIPTVSSLSFAEDASSDDIATADAAGSTAAGVAEVTDADGTGDDANDAVGCCCVVL